MSRFRRPPRHTVDRLFVALAVPGSMLAVALALADALPTAGRSPTPTAAADVTATLWSVAVLWLSTAALIACREREIRLPVVMATFPGLVAIGIALAAVTPAGPADLRLATLRGWSLAWVCPTSWPLVVTVGWLAVRGARAAWLRRGDQRAGRQPGTTSLSAGRSPRW